MSKITLTHNDKEYTLEYSRQSVKTMEQQGFVLDEISSKPMTMIPLMFQGAFIKNHKGIPNRSELLEALMEMYADTLSTLMDDSPEDSGNVTWSLVR